MVSLTANRARAARSPEALPRPNAYRVPEEILRSLPDRILIPMGRIMQLSREIQLAVSQNLGALPLPGRVGNGRVETVRQQRQIAKGLQELVAPVDPFKAALRALVILCLQGPGVLPGLREKVLHGQLPAPLNDLAFFMGHDVVERQQEHPQSRTSDLPVNRGA